MRLGVSNEADVDYLLCPVRSDNWVCKVILLGNCLI